MRTTKFVSEIYCPLRSGLFKPIKCRWKSSRFEKNGFENFRVKMSCNCYSGWFRTFAGELSYDSKKSKNGLRFTHQLHKSGPSLTRIQILKKNTKFSNEF